MSRESRGGRGRDQVPSAGHPAGPPGRAGMTTHEINEWISDLIDGLPAPLIITRLCLTIVALVEMGGPPAADALRAIVALRGQGGGDYSEEPPAALVERMRES